MRKFIECKLSIRKVVWPLLGMVIVFWGWWVLEAFVGSRFFYDPGLVFFESSNLVAMAVRGVLLWVMLMAFSALLFPLARVTMESIAYDGESVMTDYNFGRYMGYVVWGSLLTVITMGVYAPWFVVRLTRYLLENSSWRLRPFGFLAKPMDLFAIVTLVAVLLPLVFVVVLRWMMSDMPMLMEGVALYITIAILLIAFVLWMAYYCVLVSKWMIDLSCGDRRAVCRVSTGAATTYLAGQIALTILTCGLYAPMLELRLMQYLAYHTEVGEEGDVQRFGMMLRPWRDWAFVLLWGLATVVTLGLLLPVYYSKILERFGSRLYVEPKE